MSRRTKIGLFLLAIGALILIFALWYKAEYSMDKAEEFQVNSPDFNNKLLIASQGSAFKKALTQHVIDNFKQDSIFINVIDVSSLSKISPTNYNAILLIHTWENWKPPIDIEEFINNSILYKNKIIVFTTSGQGTFKMNEVDAITGESKLEDVAAFSNVIIEKLTPLLNSKMP